MSAPLIVVGGQVVGDPTIYSPWDPSLNANPDAATQDNRGCPPGWACIYVQDPATGGTAKVCRLLDQSVLGPQAAATIANETGPDFWDSSLINIANASAAVVGGVANAANALSPFLGGTGLLLIGAVAAFLYFGRK